MEVKDLKFQKKRLMDFKRLVESEQKYWELVFVVCGIGFVVFGGLIGGKTGYCDYE